MALSPEEKKKIEEEERFRAEARQKHDKPKKKGIGCGGVIGAVFIIGILSAIGLASMGDKTNTTTTTTPSTTTATTPAKLLTGQEGVLTLAGLPTAWLAKEKESYSELSKALTISDSYAIADLLQTGKIFEAAKGSKVLVIDSTLTSLNVRILDGTEAVGQAGWLPYEWVSAQ